MYQRSNFNKIFWGIFGLSFIMIIVQYFFVAFIGYSAVKEVKENNGSIGLTIGKFIGDVKEGME